jgi:hypothetical protein
MWQAPASHVEVQLTGWLLDGGIPLLLLYSGALFVALRFSYLRAVATSERSRQDVAVIVLCMQLILISLCMTGPVFNTQLGIMFWAVTGALFGATLHRDDDRSDDHHEAAHA